MSAFQQSNSFSAHLALPAGVAVSITALTLADLSIVVGKLHEAANAAENAGKAPAPVAATPAPKPAAPAPAKASTPSPTPAPAATPAAPATAPAAASGSASGGEAKRPTYDDVKERVLALTKVSRETCINALAKFGVDHGTKLKLEDYPGFLAHADELLKAGAK